MNQDASSTIGKHLRELADNGCTVGLGRIRGPKMHRYFSDTQVRDNRCNSLNTMDALCDVGKE